MFVGFIVPFAIRPSINVNLTREMYIPRHEGGRLEILHWLQIRPIYNT